jgi:acyl carrier protein phosphodiesterase
MNYLAHAYLTKSEDQQVLMGNLMGDFVKGNQYLQFEKSIQDGIILHRHIDTFTDAHHLIREIKNIFRPACGLYSGILVDTLLDHYLANDARIFKSDKQLTKFVEHIYTVCNNNRELMNLKMSGFISSMVKYNWLYNYKFKEGIHQSFRGMEKRMIKFPDANKAIDIFEKHYAIIGNYYTQLIIELEMEFLYND